MKERTAFRLAWFLWGLQIGGVLASLVFGAITHELLLTHEAGAPAPFVATLLFVVAFSTVGAVLASKRPPNPIGWLLSMASLSFVIGYWTVFLQHFSETDIWGHWLGWIWGVGTWLGTFVLLLFPTGTLPSRRWRPVAWVGCIGIAAFVLGSAFAPGNLSGPHTMNPIGIGGVGGPIFRFLRGGFGLVLIAALASIVSIGLRFRRADSLEREQLKWLVFAVGLILLSVVADGIVGKAVRSPDLANNLSNAITATALSFVPIAIGIAVLKYRLYDIDVVINKTLVYGSLAGFITAVYVAIVVGIGALIGQGSSKPNLGLSILATAVVALSFGPVRDRVQRLANRLVYGKRATPYEVLSEFSSRMAGAVASEDLLPRMARILAEGTGARTAVVWLKVGGELRPETAWPADDLPTSSPALTDGQIPDLAVTLALPVHHRGELLGAVSLTKPPGERLTPAEEHLAGDLAAGAGLVLRNVRLTEELLARLKELKASRQRIVAAQDEERRRLERNIHDGAQQQLVALAVKVRLARQLGAKDPARANELLEQTETELSQALEDLRDLARGIYPPLLANRGLVAALEGQARRSAVPVQIEAEGMSRYPQDREAAVYFCCLEALQNVAKYAQAGRVLVRLAEGDGALEFTIVDDGVGFDPLARGYGTGLQGMADRLSALGGELRVDSEPGRGTTVTGRLPVAVGEDEGHSVLGLVDSTFRTT